MGFGYKKCPSVKHLIQSVLSISGSKTTRQSYLFTIHHYSYLPAGAQDKQGTEFSWGLCFKLSWFRCPGLPGEPEARRQWGLCSDSSHQSVPIACAVHLKAQYHEYNSGLENENEVEPEEEPQWPRPSVTITPGFWSLGNTGALPA